MSPSPLVWLITGTSTGLGRELTLAALKRGDKVIATARPRSFSQIQDLKTKGADTLELDVTSSIETLHEVAKKAVAIYGKVDVVVNNAGYFLVGAVEENTPQETSDLYNTNVFGAVNVSRAFLPYMRQRKSGTIIFMGSIGGWRDSGAPNAGLYASTKYALRGINATLNAEIAPLGLRSICVDFGYFRTEFLTSDHRKPHVGRIADYEEITKKAEDFLQAYNGKQPGDPVKGVEVLLDLVRDEGVAKGKPFPVNIQLGSDCYNTVKSEIEVVLKRMEEWKEVSKSTDI